MNRSLIIPCFILFVFVFVSCKPEEERALVNYWKLCDSKNTMRDSVKNALENAVNLMEQSVDSIKDLTQRMQFADDMKSKRSIIEKNESIFRTQTDSSFLDISVNGLYDCNLYGNREAGAWTYDKTKSELVTKPAGKSTENRLKVMRVNSDTLMLGTDSHNYMLFYSTHHK